MRRTVVIAALLALASSLPCNVFAQATLPMDVTNPLTDDGTPGGRDAVPDLLDPDVLNLPDVQFIFDGLLDPDQISLIEQVTRANIDDPRLTAAAQSLIRNHLVALQQVELAIQFLQANRDDILTGNNTEFNSVFGNPGELRDVAVVNPEGIAGLANVVTALTGSVILEFPDNTTPNLPDHINPGDFVFVGDAINGDPLGFVMEVQQIVTAADGTDQMLIGNSTFGGAITAVTRTAVPVHVIINFERRTDPVRFERVIQTFNAIKTSLTGLDVDLPAILQSAPNSARSAISYQRDFEDINTIWAPGVAPFTTLDDVVRRELDRTGLTSTRTADRLIRQAGFSNSDSHFHIDRLDDQAFNQATDYQGRETFPLLWTEDNELPLNFGVNTQVSGTTDEDRAYFRDRQTIFGEPDNPFVQYIGRAFLDETIFHSGDFFDASIADTGTPRDQTFLQTVFFPSGNSLTLPITRTDSLELRQTQERRPVRGPNARTLGLDIFRVPESGEATMSQTERRKWQMIIESFAEHSTDLSRLDTAAVGLAGIVGDFLPPDLRARNAGSFADFAAIIGGSGGLNGINPNRIEPFGKRGTAGFNPVVPRN
jgi:hypothetical protein